MEQNFLTYKGRPLVRSGDTIYYGNMADKYVALIQIKSKKMQDEQEIADQVIIQLLATDEKLSLKDRIANKGERRGLAEAIELADIWLTRYLKDEK
ncbi:MAG: hypothetical protein J6A26_00105 [Oscillospiraceae bacterium]|nr:hypothetical protein [Oscillospiraceae bacterium]